MNATVYELVLVLNARSPVECIPAISYAPSVGSEDVGRVERPLLEWPFDFSTKEKSKDTTGQRGSKNEENEEK